MNKIPIEIFIAWWMTNALEKLITFCVLVVFVTSISADASDFELSAGGREYVGFTMKGDEWGFSLKHHDEYKYMGLSYSPDPSLNFGVGAAWSEHTFEAIQPLEGEYEGFNEEEDDVVSLALFAEYRWKYMYVNVLVTKPEYDSDFSRRKTLTIIGPGLAEAEIEDRDETKDDTMFWYSAGFRIEF